MGTPSFEGAVLEKADIDMAYERARKILDGETPREENFIEPYGKENVDRDLARVGKREAEFARSETPHSRELKKIAEIFEAIVLENGELANWFGGNAFTIKTSKYDDYENGVDAVIEFRGEDPGTASYLGLAADITFSSDTTQKFDRLREQIEKGELAKVKYFHSEHMNIHGQLSKLPEVIIGADRKTVLELADLWMENEKKVLAEHKIQIMILEQVRAQLETFALYAQHMGKNDLAAIFRDRLIIVQRIIGDKKEIFEKVKFDLMDDQVHVSIMGFLRAWNAELSKARQVA